MRADCVSPAPRPLLPSQRLGLPPSSHQLCERPQGIISPDRIRHVCGEGANSPDKAKQLLMIHLILKLPVNWSNHFYTSEHLRAPGALIRFRDPVETYSCSTFGLVNILFQPFWSHTLSFRLTRPVMSTSNGSFGKLEAYSASTVKGWMAVGAKSWEKHATRVEEQSCGSWWDSLQRNLSANLSTEINVSSTSQSECCDKMESVKSTAPLLNVIWCTCDDEAFFFLWKPSPRLTFSYNI